MSFLNSVTTGSANSGAPATATKTLGKDEFLQLLITKMQYQDPMEPMDDEDFIAQLAQFSTLEQMNNISAGIAQSNEFDFLQMQSLNNTMAAGLIGKDVRAEFSGMYVENGKSLDISYTLDVPASDVTFDIYAQDGSLVATISKENIPLGANTIEWDGRDRQGNVVDDGYYTVQATATDKSGDEFTPEMQLVGRVESIAYRNGVAYLKVAGVEISLGDVMAIGEEGSFSQTGETTDETPDEDM